jgi:outer membrane protein assembly factor BamB
MTRSVPLVALALLIPVLAARAENWAGWRGPNNLGISHESKLPLTWSATTNVRWKVPVPGAGVSAPVVWDDRIVLTASDGRLNDRLHVFCYHRDDGRLLWHTRLFGSAPTDLYAPGGMAVPTPATDGKALYVLFGTGELAALDFAGKPLWIRSLAEEYGPFRNRWGMGTSPILAGGLLLVQVDHWSQSYLLAVDPRTGSNRWKTERPAAVNWTSPLVVSQRGKQEIITIGTYFVRGYDLASGKELWQVEGTHQQCIPSPVIEDDLIIACSGENTMAIRLDGTGGDLTKTNVVWKNKKVNAFVPSPLLYEGHVYVPADKGYVTCLNVQTGKQAWKERLGDQFHASPVAGAGRIYFATKEGLTRVIKAGPEFELLASNDIGESIVASPAIAGGRIYLRSEKHVFCIEEK